MGKPLREFSVGSSLGALCMLALLVGCAAITNPTLNGIPVRRLPTELLIAPRRESCQTIPLALLRQDAPEEYVLGADDVLGVFIPGVIPPIYEDQPLTLPPVNYPGAGSNLPPSMGYPIVVRKDGTLQLPLVEPVRVAGLTLEQAQDTIRRAYFDTNVLPADRAAILVTLLQMRSVRVLVFREEVGGFQAGTTVHIASNSAKRGTGHTVDLRGNENDVLHALVQSGGLPGLDAFDSVFIFRGGLSSAELMSRVENRSPDCSPTSWDDLNLEIVHLPTRMPSWDPLPFQPEDIVLHNDDVVLIDARARDLFYTGGLLPRGEYPLPRDYDLDVIEAVAYVRGTLLNGSFGGNNLNGLLIQPGIGYPNPSALTVVRRSPNGGQIPISVDLNRALRDPRERIVVQPGDVLILQETSGEAIARYFSSVFNFNLVSSVISRGATSGTTTLNVP